MARGHGRILASIWEDDDFLALTQPQQRLYLFLISQPNLNHAGLLPMTLRRWARKAAGLTASELELQLDALAAAGFIVLDDDTEEILIRTFVRNDGVWRMPKVMGAMVSGAMEIESKALRRALVAEMDRIPLDELSTEPTKLRSGEGPSIRDQVAEHITTLRKAFGNPDPTPSGGGSTTPSATPSATPSDPPAEGGPIPSTRAGAGASGAQGHAGAQMRAAPAPTPAPNPNPRKTPPYPPAVAGRPAVVETGERQMPDRMTDAFLDRYRTGNAYSRRQVRKVIADTLANGTEPTELWNALERLGDTSKPVTSGTLQFAFSELRRASTGAEVIPFAGRRTASTTDQRVQAALDLAAEFRALEGGTP
ncbi:hypothetical protein [Streptomyces sp. NPDC047097]|uniref:hypothetical protein n=1 Tax=Streptomyces sp. NPDC047097 TaxID=3155260 RepID=UPI0033C3125F